MPHTVRLFVRYRNGDVASVDLDAPSADRADRMAHVLFAASINGRLLVYTIDAIGIMPKR